MFMASRIGTLGAEPLCSGGWPYDGSGGVDVMVPCRPPLDP
jgi:hypothetical protein